MHTPRAPPSIAPAAGTNRSAAAGGAPRAAAPYLRDDEALFAEHEATLLPDVGGLPFRPHLGPAGRGAAPGLPSQTAHFSETAFWIRPRGAWTGVHWDAVSARRELLTRGGGHFWTLLMAVGSWDACQVNALLHQLHGSRRIELWPPAARSSLYPSAKCVAIAIYLCSRREFA